MHASKFHLMTHPTCRVKSLGFVVFVALRIFPTNTCLFYRSRLNYAAFDCIERPTCAVNQLE
eukprot:m.8563 g.8563  ORF g.8563 m.8563 type:complete len:62 (-) comp5371_c0_seq1:8-193(-)